MKYTADKVENEITLLPLLLKILSLFQMRIWYDKEPDGQNDVNFLL